MYRLLSKKVHNSDRTYEEDDIIKQVIEVMWNSKVL